MSEKLDVCTKVPQSNGLSSIKFLAESSDPITVERAKAGQEEAGYPVAGYDFFAFETYKKGAKYYAKWCCFNNAD